MQMLDTPDKIHTNTHTYTHMHAHTFSIGMRKGEIFVRGDLMYIFNIFVNDRKKRG